MQTWLDYWVDGASATARQAGLPADRITNDRDAAWLMCVAAVARQSPGDTDQVAQIAMYVAMIPFLAPHTLDLAPPYGLRLSRDTVEMLIRARPPATQLDREALSEHSWYIDIPHRTVMVSDEQQVRAIFATPAADRQDGTSPRGIALVAILTRPGSDQITGRYAWMWDYPEQTAGSDIEVRDPRDVREAVTDLVRLVILYHLTARHQDCVELPRGTAAQLAGRNARRWQKKASLFRQLSL